MGPTQPQVAAPYPCELVFFCTIYFLSYEVKVIGMTQTVPRVELHLYISRELLKSVPLPPLPVKLRI